MPAVEPAAKRIDLINPTNNLIIYFLGLYIKKMAYSFLTFLNLNVKNGTRCTTRYIL